MITLAVSKTFNCLWRAVTKENLLKTPAIVSLANVQISKFCSNIQGSHYIGYLWVSLILDQSEFLICYFLRTELTLFCTELTLLCTELPGNFIFPNQEKSWVIFPCILLWLKSYAWFEITGMIWDQNCTTRGSITTLFHPFWNRPNTGLDQVKYFIDAALSRSEIKFIQFLGGKSKSFRDKSCKIWHMILFIFNFPAVWQKSNGESKRIDRQDVMFIIKICQISNRYILALSISEINFKPLTFGRKRVSG